MRTKHTILLALFTTLLLFNFTFAQYAIEKVETATPDGKMQPVGNMPAITNPKSPTALSGTYTVGGASPNYATIKLAIADLIAQGVSGPVIFSIRPGTYTDTLQVDPFAGASSTNTVTFQKESGAVTVSAVGNTWNQNTMIRLNGCDYVTFDGIDVSDGGTTSADQVEYGYLLQTEGGLGANGATYNVIKNCSILLGGGGSVPSFSHGVLISNTTTAVASNSFNAIRNVTIDRSDRGIGLFGQFDGTNTPTSPDNGNEISNCTLGQTTYIGNNLTTGGSAIGIIPSAQINFLIFNNVIHSVRLNNTSNTGGVTGIAVQTSSGLVYNNQILQVYQASTASSTARAIGIQTGAITSGIVKFYNNFISGINKGYTGAASATFSVFGIRSTNFAGGGGVNEYYYNTIYLNSVSAVPYASIVFGSFAGGVNMVTKNNIFVNTISTSSSTARSGAIQDANASTGFLTSNYNCFAASGTNGVIGVNGAATYRTSLADWQAANTGLDGNSFVEVPPFLNVATLPYNLHINTAIGTQVESRGTVIAGITTDIDGDLRFGAGGYGGSGTAPDVGADEGNFIFLDITPPSIAYSLLLNTSSTSSRTLVVTVTDGSGIPSTAPGWPYLYWKINAGSWNATAPSSVTGSQYTYNLGSGVVTGDIVYYYVVAQDQAATPNVGAFPSAGASGFSTNPPAASTPPTTPSSYKITTAGLSGTYTVGLSLFNSVTGNNIYFEKSTRTVQKEVPISSLEKVKGTPETSSIDLSSNKTQLIDVEEVTWIPMENGMPYTGKLYINKSENPQLNYPGGIEGVYSTITAALADLNEKGLSGPVTFSLVDNTYPTETYPLAVDVFNLSATTSVNTLTIKPAATITPAISGAAANSQIFLIKNSYVTLDGSNSGGTDRSITLTNTSATSPQVIRVASSGSTLITDVTIKNCLAINGANSSSAIVASDLTGVSGNFSNLTIQNNDVQKAYIGIFCNAATGFGSNLLVKGNNLNTSGANAIRYIGIYAQGFNGVTISDNQIANFNGTNDEDDRGVWLASGSINGVIENNKIHSLNYTGVNGLGVHGIAVSSSTTSANHVIKNNMISNLSGDGWTYTTTDYADNTFGIYVFGTQTGIKLYHNSIYLSGNTLNQTNALSAGIVLGTGSTADIRNNIIVNNLGLLGAVGFGSTGIFLQSASSQLGQSNFNDISVAPTGSGTALVGNIGASNNYSTLSGWQTATFQDAYSVSTPVTFAGLTDLHLSGGSVGDGNLASAYLSAVPTDIDGNTRNLYWPYMGADEVTASPLSLKLTLKALIQGFYAIGNNDTLSVFLAKPIAPYTRYAPVRGLTSTSGLDFYLPKTNNETSYYVGIKHRNSVETWSASTISTASFPASYDFTSAQAQAFGSNQVQVGVVAKWCIYGGDVNQDGVVDLTDVGNVDTDNLNFVSGYVVSDVNGDLVTDIADVGLVDTNNLNFVSKQTPGGVVLSKKVKAQEKIDKGF